MFEFNLPKVVPNKTREMDCKQMFESDFRWSAKSFQIKLAKWTANKCLNLILDGAQRKVFENKSCEMDCKYVMKIFPPLSLQPLPSP